MWGSFYEWEDCEEKITPPPQPPADQSFLIKKFLVQAFAGVNQMDDSLQLMNVSSYIWISVYYEKNLPWSSSSSSSSSTDSSRQLVSFWVAAA